MRTTVRHVVKGKNYPFARVRLLAFVRAPIHVNLARTVRRMRARARIVCACRVRVCVLREYTYMYILRAEWWLCKNVVTRRRVDGRG